ncbi:MAG: chemotaxis protein CheW [Planctomycetota bacterium]|jgi:purine-binding chemotaxis protein CheW|nr:chemotaxis protein CheW [Planctomycetota bacterium]
MSNTIKKLELMTFQIGDYSFGIDINDIQEINCHARMSKVPVDYEAVAGVINLRGEVLTVIALGKMLGIKSSNAGSGSSNYIVVKTANHRVAIAVDKLKDVETIPASELKHLPANFKLSNQHVLMGLVQKPEGLLLVLDSTRVTQLGILNLAVAC